MSLIKTLRKTCRKALFTTPSHGQKFFILNKMRNIYKYDISETDFFNPQEALSKAEEHAKKIYGSKSISFLLNGSTSGVIASILTCVKQNENVLIWNKAHISHINSIKLACANPILYEIEESKDWGIPLKTNPDIIEKKLKEYKIKAVIVTSPSYEGIVSDIKKIKKLCEKHGAYLIVDEAHGALYPFSENLPQSSIKIADFTIQSLHKTAGGLNPTALLHCNCDLDVKPYLAMITTTSPSYPLLASIEANVNYLNSKRGKKHLENLIINIKTLKKNCTNCEFYGDDITKILVKHKYYSGFELSKFLYEKENIEDEKTNEKSTLLLCGIGTDEKKLKRLEFALKKL